MLLVTLDTALLTILRSMAGFQTAKAEIVFLDDFQFLITLESLELVTASDEMTRTVTMHTLSLSLTNRRRGS